MRVCEHARNLRRRGSEQRGLLVHEYGGSQLRLGRYLAQVGGREDGIGWRVGVAGGLRRRIVVGL